MIVTLSLAIVILPSTIVGFLLARRVSRALTFLGMLAAFFLTVAGLWSSLNPLFNSTQGVVALIAEIVVASTVSSVRLPIVTRLASTLSRPPQS